MTAERRERPENILDLAGSGLESELTDNQESVWRDVVRRVDEVYSDLLRYEADLESKNAELEEAQSFISSVIASVSDILVVCDENGLVLQANPAFVALLGQSEPELIGRALLDFVVEEDHDQARRHLCAGPRGEAGAPASDCELHFHTARGPSDVMAINFSGRFDHSGRCVGSVLTGRPIGELRRAYQALHGAHLELQKAQRKLIEQEKMASLGRLVAGVAHELNNPISFVYGNVHVLDRYRKVLADYFAEEDQLDASAGGDLRRKYRVDSILADLEPLIEGTLEGAKRISEIVKNLRRISFNRAHEAHRIDVERILATATQWAARAKKNHARIDVEVAPGLAVWGNEGQIHQIVVNLIDNALDAVHGRKQPAYRGPRGFGGGRGRDRRRRQWRRHRRCRLRQDVRALLHHENRGRGHRPRPVDILRHRPRARRLDRGGQSGRGRRAVHAEAAGRRLRLRRFLFTIHSL